MTDSSPVSSPKPKIDTTVAHSARIWNYWLGGKDNYPVDREVGDQIRQLHPDIGEYARADRAFLARAVRYLAAEAGIRQFLDIGTGLPTTNNVHEVAQRVAHEIKNPLAGISGAIQVARATPSQANRRSLAKRATRAAAIPAARATRIRCRESSL